MYKVGEQGKYSILLLKKDVIAVTSFLVVRGISFASTLHKQYIHMPAGFPI